MIFFDEFENKLELECEECGSNDFLTIDMSIDPLEDVIKEAIKNKWILKHDSQYHHKGNKLLVFCCEECMEPYKEEMKNFKIENLYSEMPIKETNIFLDNLI